MARHTVGGFTALALGIAAFAPVPVHAAARPALTNVVEVRGSRAAYVPVRLTRTASVELAGISTAGGGRLAAAVLVREPVATTTVSVVIGRLAPGALPVLLPVSRTGFDSTGGAVRLPAGNYRLYVVGDDRATTVRFRLRGAPAGTTRVAPRVRARAAVASPAPVAAAAPPGRFAYSTGTDQAVRGPALHVAMLVVRHDVHALSDYWLCGYRGTAATRPYVYTHGCPNFVANDLTDQAHFLVAVESARAMTTMVFSGLAPYGSGHYGNGAAFVTTTPALSAEYAHLWLGL